MEVGAGDVCVGGRGYKCGWWSEGEMTDLYCGHHRPREYAALCAWHPLETCCLPGVQGKNTEPRPEKGGKKRTGTMVHSVCMDIVNPISRGTMNATWLLNTNTQNGRKLSYLSEKWDWFLTHGVGIAYVSLDDFCERFLDSLGQRTGQVNLRSEIKGTSLDLTSKATASQQLECVWTCNKEYCKWETLSQDTVETSLYSEKLDFLLPSYVPLSPFCRLYMIKRIIIILLLKCVNILTWLCSCELEKFWASNCPLQDFGCGKIISSRHRWLITTSHLCTPPDGSACKLNQRQLYSFHTCT